MQYLLATGFSCSTSIERWLQSVHQRQVVRSAARALHIGFVGPTCLSVEGVGGRGSRATGVRLQSDQLCTDGCHCGGRGGGRARRAIYETRRAPGRICSFLGFCGGGGWRWTGDVDIRTEWLLPGAPCTAAPCPAVA